jgi:protein SCO1/2
VTTDPKRDTDAVLTDYVTRFNPTYKALTGNLLTIAKVAKSIGVFVDKGNPLAGGGYDPNSHGSYVIGINSRHQAPIFWNGETAPSEFAADFNFLLTEKPQILKGPNN